jgi:hypothetical protein
MSSRHMAYYRWSFPDQLFPSFFSNSKLDREENKWKG